MITAHEPWKNHRCSHAPSMPTTATNQALLRPKLTKKTKSAIKGKGKSKEDAEDNAPLLHRNKSSSSSSALSSRSGLVDLVVEDTEAEETEHVRARKEGGPGWNGVEARRFIRTYPDEHYGEEIRQGFDPAADTSLTGIAKGEESEQGRNTPPEGSTSVDGPFEVGDDETETEDESRGGGVHVNGDSGIWEDGHEQGSEFGDRGRETSYGSLNEERSIWGRPE